MMRGVNLNMDNQNKYNLTNYITHTMIMKVLFKVRGTTQDVLTLRAMPMAPLTLLGTQTKARNAIFF